MNFWHFLLKTRYLDLKNHKSLRCDLKHFFSLFLETNNFCLRNFSKFLCFHNTSDMSFDQFQIFLQKCDIF
jgi:hypothetical protein